MRKTHIHDPQPTSLHLLLGKRVPTMIDDPKLTVPPSDYSAIRRRSHCQLTYALLENFS